MTRRSAAAVGLTIVGLITGACGGEPAEPSGPPPVLAGKILFTSDLRWDAPGQVEAMNADGTARNRLTKDAAYYSDPVWSLAAKRIAFTRRQTFDGDGSICVMNADGSAPSCLTQDPLADYGAPAWSPNGKKIAFARHRTGATCLARSTTAPCVAAERGIYVMNADGTALTRLTIPPAQLTSDSHNIEDDTPAWSPDGRTIAFARGEAGYERSIFVMNADGTGVKRITTPGSYVDDSSPAWSPDGRKIAFVRGDGARSNIYVMNSDGGATRKLTKKGDNAKPTWSPSGAAIAFASNRDAGPGHGIGGLQIYVMNASGTAVTRITNDAAEAYDPNWYEAI